LSRGLSVSLSILFSTGHRKTKLTLVYILLRVLSVPLLMAVEVHSQQEAMRVSILQRGPELRSDWGLKEILKQKKEKGKQNKEWTTKKKTR
jgi:hypothetical protein